MKCEINSITVKNGIQNAASNMLEETRQFERVDQSTVRLIDTSKLLSFLSSLNFKVDLNADEILKTTKVDYISNGEVLTGAIDVMQKFIAIAKGSESEKLPELSAYIIYEMLGKKNKLNKDLWFNIDKWSKYDEIYNKYKNQNLDSEINDFIEILPDEIDKIKNDNYNPFARKMAIVSLIKEMVNTYNSDSIPQNKRNSEDVTKEYFEKRGYKNPYEQNLLIRLWNQFLNWINENIKGNSKFDNYTEASLKDLVLDIVDDIFKEDYNKFLRGVKKENDYLIDSNGTKLVLKDYNESINADKKAKEIIDTVLKSIFLHSDKNISPKLSGSATTRKYGTTFRKENETFHDLDFVIPLTLVQSEELYNEILLKINRNLNNLSPKFIELEIIPLITKQSWYRNLKQFYPNFTLLNSFIGKDHSKGESITLTGVIDGEFKNGKYIPDTGYIVDFFYRTKEGNHPEEFDSYWKSWKGIFEAKLNMGRSKDLVDFIYFDPFIEDKYKFNKKGYRYFSFSSNIQNVVSVYQGFDTLDSREINYYTLNRVEALDYGKNIREVKINIEGFLKKNSDEFNLLKRDFKKQSGKTFDLMDNSEEGLSIQNEFFQFLKQKGYKGLENINSIDSQYVISFDNTSIQKATEEIISSVNSAFGEQIVKETENALEYKIEPSEKLIDAYLKSNSYQDNFKANPISIEEEKYNSLDINYILTKLQMTKKDTLNVFIDKYNINIDKFKDVNFDFTEFDTNYDSTNNTIYISLREMHFISLNTGIPLKEVINIYIEHEYAHAKSVFALQNSKNREYLNSLFQKARKHYGNNPFEDKLRQGLNDGSIPYSLSSLEEFIADAFSNPYFQEWLKSIPEEEKTIWDKIIDFLRDLLGFNTKSNTYNRVIDFVNSEKFQRENTDIRIRNLNEGLTTYRGNPSVNPSEDDYNKDNKPKDYISATFEFFTQDIIKEDLLNFMNSLPYQMSQLRKRLDTEKDKQTRERIQKLLDAYGEVKGNEKVIPVYINMFISAAKVANDLKDLQLQAEKETDNNKKIQLLYNLQQSSERLSDIAQLASEVLNILENQGSLSSIQPFINDLNTITSISSRIKRTISTTMSPAVIQWFYSQNPDTEVYKKIQEEINAIKTKPDYNKNQKYYDERIRRKEKELEKLPVPETFKKIFSGKYEDASIIQMQLEAIHMNQHPIIYTLAANLKEIDIKSAQEMQKLANDFTTKFEKYIKDNNITSLRDQDKLWAKFRQPVKYISKIEENEDGTLNIKEETTDMLVSEYSPEYLSKFLYFQAYNDFYYDEFLKANRDKDEEKANKYQNLYLENKKARQKFEEENSNRRYVDEVYTMYALLDKEIQKNIDGQIITTTLRKEKGDLFQEINNLEHIRDTAGSLEEQKHYQDLIQQKYIELNELKSEYDKYGNQKTGYDLEVAKILKEYSELKRKYGVYELTEMGQASFERDILDIEKRFSEGRISKEQRDDLLSQMTKTQPTQLYYDLKDQIDEVLNQALDKIASIPELEPFYSKETKEKTKETYKKLRTLVAAFRDSEGTINGQLFSNTRPELVPLVKELQQAQEDIKNATEKATSLSIEESIRLSELYSKSKKKIITVEEKIELTDLKKKLEEKKKIAKKYEVELKALSDAFKQIGELDEIKNSEYYLDELNNQKNILKSSLKRQVENEFLSKFLSEGDQILMEGRFIKDDGVWYENVKQKKKTVKTPIIGNESYSPEEIIVDKIVNERIDIEIENTEWFNNNHYIKYVWNKKAKTYLPIKVPIYIWAETKPKDENMLEKKPSLKYLTYRIKDGRSGEENFYNPDFSEIKNYIPSPKKGKFENPTYNTLNNAEKIFLEDMRAIYKKAQSWYPSENMNGDILPSIVKTNEELRVETTNNLLKGSTYINLFKIGLNDEQDEDTSFLLGGSQKKVTELPIRFTSKLPSNKISKNIPGMILTFAQHAKRYENLKPQQDLYENIREVVANLEVSESLNLAKSFSVRNIFSAGKNNAKRISKTKNINKTNLSKTVDYMLDTYFYGQRKTSSILETPYGNIDMQKVGTGLKKLSSYSIFTLNMFNAVKNTFSAKIQQVINTNKSQGFYSDKDLAKAQLRAMSYVKDYVQDYKKFGNKSFIGRALDYFTVLQGAIHDEYGRKTQWTELKDLPNKLTILKNISEFELQITQFLAMAEANKVEINGKMVSFIDAFEIRNNQFELKKEANLTQKDIQKFINKVHLINRYVNGAYREDERNALQKTVLGDLAFYLNGYFMPAFRNRFGNTIYSYESETIQKGYWNETFQFIKDIVIYRRNIFARWNDMNQDEKARVLSFVKELSYIAALAILIMLMGGGEDKKELSQRSNLNLFLLATAIAVKSETESFVPFPGMGFNEIARKLNSPFAAMRQITNLIKLLENFIKFVGMSDEAFYKQSGIKDGFHDKGDPKFIANFLKLIGWSGTAFDPLEKVTQVKAQQNLR